MKPARILLIDDLRLDLAARRVFRDEEEIELGRLTFDLFAAVAQAAPAALSADEIVARVWDSKVVTDETLQQRVSLLRRALGQGSSREYVQTVRGFGYRLATEPVPFDEPHSPANQADSAPSGEDVSQAESKMASPGPTRTPGARLLRAVLITLAILALLLAITVLAMVVRKVKRWTPESFSTSVAVQQVGLEEQVPDPLDQRPPGDKKRIRQRSVNPDSSTRVLPRSFVPAEPTPRFEKGAPRPRWTAYGASPHKVGTRNRCWAKSSSRGNGVIRPSLTFSPDGRWLLLAQLDRIQSDVVLVEGYSGQ